MAATSKTGSDIGTGESRYRGKSAGDQNRSFYQSDSAEESDDDDAPILPSSSESSCRVLEATTIGNHENTNIVCIFDMVTTVIQALLIGICIIPNETGSVALGLLSLLPCVVRLCATIFLYRKTDKIHELPVETVLYSSLFWLILSFLTVVYETVYLSWITVTGSVTKFLIFIVGFKVIWTFLPIFFVNELYNEIHYTLYGSLR